MIYCYLPSLAVQVHFQSGILHKPSVSAGGGWVTGGADVGHLLPTSAGHLPDRGVVCFRSVPQFVHFVKTLALFTPTSLQPSQFTPAPVYTHHSVNPVQLQPAQSTPTSVNLVQLIQLSLHPPLWKPRAVTSSSVYTQLFVIPVQITPTPVYTQLILFTALFTPIIVYTIFVYTQVCLHPTHSVYTIVYTHLCLHPSLLIPSADEVSV